MQRPCPYEGSEPQRDSLPGLTTDLTVAPVSIHIARQRAKRRLAAIHLGRHPHPVNTSGDIDT
jgi:hypothetical protein